MNLNEKKIKKIIGNCCGKNQRIPEIFKKDFSEFLIQFISNKLYLS